MHHLERGSACVGRDRGSLSSTATGAQDERRSVLVIAGYGIEGSRQLIAADHATAVAYAMREKSCSLLVSSATPKMDRYGPIVGLWIGNSRSPRYQVRHGKAGRKAFSYRCF
jgi:hypothetical protein